MLIVKNHTSSDNVPSKRFRYQDGVAFWIRPVTGTIMRDLRKKCITGNTVEFNPRSRTMETVEQVDDEKYDRLITDYIIDKWEGIGGEDGNPLPVTVESKRLILDQAVLSEFVWAAAKSLDTSGPEAKNLQTSRAS